MRGRPTAVSNGKAVTVYLDDVYIRMARREGDGNISAGIRRMISSYIRLAMREEAEKKAEENPFG